MPPIVPTVHVAAAACVLTVVSEASADKLFMYRFAESGSDLTAAIVNDHPLSATDMAFGAGASQASGHFGNRLGLDTHLSTGESSAIADAVTNDSYIEFAATSDSGWGINLGRVQFRLSGYDPNDEVTPPSVAWSLRTSIDGFTADVDTGTNSVEFQDYEVEKAKFTSLGMDADNLDDVAFRIYFAHWGTDVETGVVIDQVSILGQSIPIVPGPRGLVALIGVGLVRGRRRH